MGNQYFDMDCPSCNHSMTINSSKMGEQASCPKCNSLFKIELPNKEKKISTTYVNIPITSALMNCEACNKEMSLKALACPSCGNPNKKMVNKEQNKKQKVGCLLFIIGIPLCFILPPVGYILVILGAILSLIHMRLY